MDKAQRNTRGRTCVNEPELPDLFEQAAYRDRLIQLGVSREAATEVAAKTAQAQRNHANSPKAALSKPSRSPTKTVVSKAPSPRKTALVTRQAESPIKAVYDYRHGELPERVRDLIEAHLAIEAEDAKISATKNGLVLYPSPVHVLPKTAPRQPSLFG